MTRAVMSSIAPKVTVDGTELPQRTLDAMIGMSIGLGLRLPGRARLSFLDDGFSISAGTTFALGDGVRISTGDGAVLFTGEVTGVELDVEHGAPNVTVIADDVGYKLTLGSQVRTFTKMTYSDIVEKIAREYGWTASITAPKSQREYVLQADSDFGFLNEIADRIGYDWWVDSQGVLQFHPMGSRSGSTPTIGWNSGLRHFSVRASALHPHKVTVTSWDPQGKESMNAQNEPVHGRPDAALVTPYLDARRLSSHNSVCSAHHQFSTVTEGADLATSVATQALAGAVVAEGACLVDAAIVVGGRVTVTDVGPASGTYFVTEVEHTYSERGFDTRFVAGERSPTSLADTLAAPPATSFRQDMLVVGIVTNLDDPEKGGRVRVQYPTLGGQVESTWARVVAVGAGASRGMTFIPEIGDEVIVGFEGGDATRPLVLGGIYNGRDKALDVGINRDRVERRQIVSRLGHVIELGDGTGAADQHIWLSLEGGQHAVKLGKDGLSATVPGGEPVSITAGEASIEIDKQGTIALAAQKITIAAKQDVEISGANVTVKANVNAETSAAKVKIAGSAQTDISAGGVTSVKGAMVKIN